MNLKYYKTGLLISTILLLTIMLDVLVEDNLVPILKHFGVEFMRAPGNAAIIMSILVFYDRSLWKYPVLSKLIKVPNISGRYEGSINYTWDGIKQSKPCVLEIIQTASKIKVNSYFQDVGNQKSISQSLVEEFQQEDDGFFTIHFFYLNGGSKINGLLDCHEGANILRYLPGSKRNKAKLVGHYFTNRSIQTRGEMEVTFISRSITGKF